MSLLFNTLSRFVIAFLPRSKCLLISWPQSPSTVILEPKKIECVITVSIFSWSICYEVLGLGSMTLVFFNIEFQARFFSLSFYTLIKKLLSYSLLSPIRMVSSIYLRLLIFLPGILIPSSELSCLTFQVIYSA